MNGATPASVLSKAGLAVAQPLNTVDGLEEQCAVIGPVEVDRVVARAVERDRLGAGRGIRRVLGDLQSAGLSPDEFEAFFGGNRRIQKVNVLQDDLSGVG